MLCLVLVTTNVCETRVEKLIGLKKYIFCNLFFLKNLNTYIMYCTNRPFLFISGFSVLNRIPEHRGEY